MITYYLQSVRVRLVSEQVAKKKSSGVMQPDQQLYPPSEHIGVEGRR